MEIRNCSGITKVIFEQFLGKYLFSERESMDNLDKLALARPEKCSQCQGELNYVGLGHYKCKNCGNEMMDNYGKIKEYLHEHGHVPVFQMARDLGISREDIHIILDENNSKKWEQPESTSKSFTSRYDRMHFLK